ncbi:MAG: SDR family oxidoreductase [Pirellulales bacterium]|nr:SDR family oxidoreductase [Pirellulales bacterium]
MGNSSGQRVALVTGGGKRRVGNAVARRLAQRGCAVALHYHHSAGEANQTVAELRAAGATARAFQADVSQEDDVARLARQTLDAFGRIDVLVTAAAIWEPKPLEIITAEDVRRHFDVNALGTFLCCQKVGLVMAGQNEGGAIVTMGDWATVRPYAGYAAYFPSKGAVEAMTRCLAVELAERNPRVRVNCILPGPVLLPDDLPPAERDESIAGTLVRRLGTPEHVADAVVFLVENDFVTGVCLPVDGGRTIRPTGAPRGIRPPDAPP